MLPYVYVEYPKCLYRKDETLTVETADEEAAAKKKGWKAAAEFHGSAPAPAPES